MLRRPCAIKLLSHGTSTATAMERFEREVQITARLTHPNTVAIYDYGHTPDGVFYYAMEYLEGITLEDLVDDHGPQSAPRVVHILVQACGALEEAHLSGLVHRDIKPANIMLTERGRVPDVVKVLDFGLVKETETTSPEVTSANAILGTPHYMAPEQIRGEEVDQRSDIYSIGAMMYRALTGYHPFSGEPLTVLSKHLTELPVPPHERAPGIGISAGMSRLVMRALAKDPAERFQRVEDLQSLLVEESRAAGGASVESLLDTDRVRRLAAPKAASATSDEVDAYERKLRRKRHGALGLAAVLACAAVAAGVFVPREAKVRGVEIEPNDTAAEATTLPLGQAMRGQLGRRVDENHGDRDFYALDLPAVAPGLKSHLTLQVSALPTMATCVILYRPGFDDPVGQFCGGRPGRAVVSPVIDLDPERYLLVVLQDLDSYGGERPAIQESISDTYTVLAESVTLTLESDGGPDDEAASILAIPPEPRSYVRRKYAEWTKNPPARIGR
jgi:hypothetical protein